MATHNELIADMQDRLSEMDGTWHSDSKLKAVMTASGKDRFSVKSSRLVGLPAGAQGKHRD